MSRKHSLQYACYLPSSSNWTAAIDRQSVSQSVLYEWVDQCMSAMTVHRSMSHAHWHKITQTHRTTKPCLSLVLLSSHWQAMPRGGDAAYCQNTFGHTCQRSALLSRSTQPCIPQGSLNRVPALLGWDMCVKVACAGWQVTLCDHTWHVSSPTRSGDACLPTAISVYFTYFTFTDT